MADQETITAVQQHALKIPAGLKSLMEGLIFAAEEPLTLRQIKAIYEQPGVEEERHIDQQELQSVVDALNEEYRNANRPYRIIMIAGGYQFATLKEYAEWLGRLFHEQARRRLSQSSLETLAIVSYKQPISKPEVEAIRGVNCDYVLKTLLEKELVTIVGRAETVGRPLLYGTTREFLKHFGLNEITDLPRPREIEEILGESQFETERRMLEAQEGADQAKKEEEDFKSRLPHIPRKKPELNEEVQIIPKTRARKLNLRTKEEEPSSASLLPVPESPGQVAADEPRLAALPQEVSPEAVEPATVPENVELNQIPIPVMPELPQAAVVEEPVLEDLSEVREPAPVLPGEGHSSLDELPVPREGSPSHPTIPQNEPEMTQPRRSPWTSWKTKIQTFIRKLFG
jgi:segregation and condensation protein B